MRMIESRVSPFGVKRTMLVDNTQNTKYSGGVICYMYDGAEDGPPLGFQVFYDATIDQVITYFEEECGVEPSVWSPIPDQLPGCLDEWIAPVRAFQEENGKVVAGAYERLEGENWVKFTI